MRDKKIVMYVTNVSNLFDRTLKGFDLDQLYWLRASVELGLIVYPDFQDIWILLISKYSSHFSVQPVATLKIS